MTEAIRVPGNLDIPLTVIGQLSVKNLLRLGTPILLAWITASNLGTLLFTLPIGAGIGSVWYWWRPYGRPVDVHLYHLLRKQVTAHVSEPSRVETVNHDHVRRSDGVVTALIQVDSTNLEMKTGDEQLALHNIYRELLSTITYPIQIHSKQARTDLDNYIESIADRDVEFTELREGYTDYCQKVAAGDLTATQHIITVSAAPSSLNWLYRLADQWLPHVDYEIDDEAVTAELDNRCREIISALTTSELSAERITGPRFESLAARYQLHNPEPGFKHVHNPGTGEFQRSVVITEFPSTADLAWTAQLLRTDGLVDVTQVIQPRDASRVTRKLQRISERVDAEINSFLASGYRGTNKLEALRDDVEWFLDLLAERRDHPVSYAAYITTHGNSREQCDRAFEKVCTRLRTQQYSFNPVVFRTDQAYQSQSLFGPDRLDNKQLLPAGSAAAGFPFTTHTTDQDSGVIFGIDTEEQSPVLLDRFAWSSHSMARMGMVGSGKSYATKIELFRAFLAYPQLSIYVVDPKQEYTHLIRRLGGTVHTLDGANDPEFDSEKLCFTVEQRGQEENVDRLVDTVRRIYHRTSQNQEKTLVLIDEARILLNDEQGRDVLNQFVLEGRDTNTAITLVTQNASHFTYCREGREILDNIPGKVFMRHDRVPDSVVDYFDLSQREKQELYELKTGTDADHSEALLKVSGRLDTRITVEATGQEHATIQAGGDPS